jgi:hypothetical protein
MVVVPTVTTTATPPAIIAGPPVANVCAQGWMPEALPSGGTSDSGVVHAYARISIPGLVRDRVAENVDPQSWDDCSTLWPRPEVGTPADSASLATVSSTDCTVDPLSEVTLTHRPPGSTYPAQTFYEHFSCLAPPCNAEFKNILMVQTRLQPRNVGSTTVDSYYVHYSLPVCWLPPQLKGAIWGRIDGQTVLATDDWGVIEVWESGQRTYVSAEKYVAFDNKTWTNSLGALLGLTELNEQLAEIACCRKSP